MDYFCGIDIGASTAKAVLIDSEKHIIAKALQSSGVDYTKTAAELLERLCEYASIEKEKIKRSISTGYGRGNVTWVDDKMTEIACHGKGAYFFFKKKMTVIDIGAQDCKVIHLDEKGKRSGFKMNRKCAAGTGAFIEEVARRLTIDISELNGLAERSGGKIELGSFCTVFAATEIIEKIRSGAAVEDIVYGAFKSVVKRIVEMDSVDGILVATGGVAANNPLLVKLLGEAFSAEAHIAPHAQYAGAFGAALFASETN